jgi:lipopolysaccharide export system protein LptC
MTYGDIPETAAETPLTFKKTYRWLLLILIAVSIPYLIAWLTTPEDKVFTWALQNPDDVSVYVGSVLSNGVNLDVPLYH